MDYHVPTLFALSSAMFAIRGGIAVLADTPTDALSWAAQLGPAAGAAIVAYVAFMYVRKRDEDAQKNMDRQDREGKENRDAVARLYDRVEAMGKENRDAIERVVAKMENAMRDNAQSHSNGLSQISHAIQMVIQTVTTFQKTQDTLSNDMQAMKQDVNILIKLAGIHRDPPEEESADKRDGRDGRSDSKQLKLPRQLPRAKDGGQ